MRRMSEQFNGPACFRIAEPIQEEEVMTDLLNNVVKAHGGLNRWNELENRFRVSHPGRRSAGGEGQQGVLDDVFVTASLREERESHHPFGAAYRRSVFTPGTRRDRGTH